MKKWKLTGSLGLAAIAMVAMLAVAAAPAAATQDQEGSLQAFVFHIDEDTATMLATHEVDRAVMLKAPTIEPVFQQAIDGVGVHLWTTRLDSDVTTAATACGFADVATQQQHDGGGLAGHIAFAQDSCATGDIALASATTLSDGTSDVQLYVMVTESTDQQRAGPIPIY